MGPWEQRFPEEDSRDEEGVLGTPLIRTPSDAGIGLGPTVRGPCHPEDRRVVKTRGSARRSI
jgi:hypothetical protein